MSSPDDDLVAERPDDGLRPLGEILPWVIADCARAYRLRHGLPDPAPAATEAAE